MPYTGTALSHSFFAFLLVSGRKNGEIMRKDKTKVQKKEYSAKDTEKRLFIKIGTRIRMLRKELRYSQADLAKKVCELDILYQDYRDHLNNYSGVSDSSLEYEEKCSNTIISRYELGVSDNMPLLRFINLCMALETTPNHLLQDVLSDNLKKQAEIMELFDQLSDDNKSTILNLMKELLANQNAKQSESNSK